MEGDPAPGPMPAATAPSGSDVAPASGPRLRLEGFEGPLDLLLELARAQRVDWSRLSITTLVDQFVAAVEAAVGIAPLARLGDWLVAASWLALLRSRLLLPQDPREAEAARQAADRLGRRLRAAGAAQALAAWLDKRPLLGREVFGRGHATALPGAGFGEAGPGEAWPGQAGPGEAGDVLDLLLACFDVYDGAPAREAAAGYHPPPPPLHTLPEALARLRRLLAERPEGGMLWRFLGREDLGREDLEQTDPGRRDPGCWDPGRGKEGASPLRARSNVAATFLAGLELARQGGARLEQAEAFGALSVRGAPVAG